MHKIASSPNIEGLIKLLNQFYYTNTIRIENNMVYNSKGLIKSVAIKERKGRLIAYFK